MILSGTDLVSLTPLSLLEEGPVVWLGESWGHEMGEDSEDPDPALLSLSGLESCHYHSRNQFHSANKGAKSFYGLFYGAFGVCRIKSLISTFRGLLAIFINIYLLYIIMCFLRHCQIRMWCTRSTFILFHPTPTLSQCVYVYTRMHAHNV